MGADYTVYDGSFETKEYEVGVYSGATIWVKFEYDFKFNPAANSGNFYFLLKARASRDSFLEHNCSLSVSINGSSKKTNFRGRLTTSYPKGSLIWVRLDAAPNTSGKFPATVTFTYGTLTKTFSLTDLISLPSTSPVLTANVTYNRSPSFSSGETEISAEITYYNSAANGYEGYFKFYGENATKYISLPPYGKGNKAEYSYAWTISDVGYLIQGKSYKWEMYILNDNGKSRTLTGTITVPATVNKVTIGSLSLNENSPVTNLPYTLINDYKATNFAVTSVTYKGNNDAVATIDSQGRITVHSSGYVIFTVTSNDAIGGNPSASKYFYIASVSGFPFGDEEETTEWLSAPLTERIINACQMVATKQGITITGISQFSGYTTLVRNTKIVMERINDNVKKIADTKRISYDTVALTFSNTNENGEWYEMVNEWLRLMPLFKPYS